MDNSVLNRLYLFNMYLKKKRHFTILSFPNVQKRFIAIVIITFFSRGNYESCVKILALGRI